MKKRFRRGTVAAAAALAAVSLAAQAAAWNDPDQDAKVERAQEILRRYLHGSDADAEPEFITETETELLMETEVPVETEAETEDPDRAAKEAAAQEILRKYLRRPEPAETEAITETETEFILETEIATEVFTERATYTEIETEAETETESETETETEFIVPNSYAADFVRFGSYDHLLVTMKDSDFTDEEYVEALIGALKDRGFVIDYPEWMTDVPNPEADAELLLAAVAEQQNLASISEAEYAAAVEAYASEDGLDVITYHNLHMVEEIVLKIRAERGLGYLRSHTYIMLDEEAETEAQTETGSQPAAEINGETEPQPAAEVNGETEPQPANTDYIFPESQTRFLTWDEVMAKSLQTVCYAKNEIYARHGRQFVSRELQDYFNSKSWYKGYIAPDQFTDTVFSQVEMTNISLLVAAEKEKAVDGMGYLLDQPGYDITNIN